MTIKLRQLGPRDVPALRPLIAMFGDAFGDDSYQPQAPSDRYLRRLLATDSFIAVVALAGGKVVGGVAAYELRKFEQERSEIYLYDLAVAAKHRRRGIATALIRKLQEIAAARGAWVIFVQADTGAEDAPAIALYSKLGRREEVLHFDIPIMPSPRSRAGARPRTRRPRPRSKG